MGRPSGSMAAWCTINRAVGQPECEVHLNYWRVAGQAKKGEDTNKNDFLEIGFLTTNAAAARQINIYVPLSIERKDITDLGLKFEDPNLAQGIFNETLSCSRQAAGSSWIDLRDKGQNLFCRVHTFAKDVSGYIDQSELSLTKQNGGTLIQILPTALQASTQNLQPPDQLYFRLRVLTGSRRQSPFVQVITPPDRILQSGFDEIEYIDFRLNESRTLPDGINRIISQDKQTGVAPTKVVAFLAAVPVLSELTVSHTEFHKNRLLEDEPWTKYAPDPLPEGMMVYHWKKISNDDIDNFAAFVKLQTRKTSGSIISKYLIIAFLFGILGNLSASAIQYAIEKAYGYLSGATIEHETSALSGKSGKQ